MYAMAMRSWTKGAELERVELPTPEPRAREVRVAVHAASVNPVDWKMRQGGPLRLAARAIRTFRGPRGPIVLGVDFAGVVEAVGVKVKNLTAGQRVYGGTNFSRGQHGSYADTVVVHADQVCALPDAVPFETAGAMVVTGVTAWMSVSEFRPIEKGRRVLVLGAAGGVGQLVVQLAKRTRGADLVAGVCSARNADLVRGLGADEVIDYTTGDALERAKAHGPFDVVVDCAGGYKASRCRGLLAPGGRHVMVAGDSPAAMAQVVVPPFRSRAILGKPTHGRLKAVADAVAAGQVQVAIAERVPLADVEAAHAKSKTGRMTGKIVLLPR
ncbi:MAG: NAD(P)-dependent alcohol dehydrogenase [Deltaproteobacteria bacterium]|nr:NAD(P)-dependent alcohol dehydrogenase [Deltaproteobacteria bacterium]